MPDEPRSDHWLCKACDVYWFGPSPVCWYCGSDAHAVHKSPAISGQYRWDPEESSCLPLISYP